MGLQSALSTALTGLTAAETTIDVVGNNVANSQTVGFKESNVNFATQFLQTISIGSAPSATSGGTNPRQIGLGVRVAEIAPDFTQGTIEISSNPLDVAIQGDGFLLIQGSQGERFYSRNGQLKTNENNEIVNATGQRVLGYNAVDGNLVTTLVPLSIPIGGSQVNQVTSNVSFSGTLSPTADVGVGGIIESSILGDSTVGFPSDMVTNDFVPTPPIVVTGVSSTPLNDGGGEPSAGGGDYLYRVTFRDPDLNETGGSLPITVTASGTGGMQLTGLPPADGTNYTARVIYRTAAGTTGPYYRVGDVTNANTITTFNDTVSDATLIGNTQLDLSAVDVGAYSYYVTYRNPTTQIETRPNAVTGTISVTQADQRVRISNIPQPSADMLPAGFTEIKIYRNLVNDASTFKLAGTITLDPITNPVQTVFMDSASDASVATAGSIDLDGPKVLTSTLLTSVQIRDGANYVPLFSGAGSLSFTGTKGGTTLDTKTLAVTSGTGGTTVGEWVTFINESLGIDASVPNAPTSNVVGGRLHIESNAGIENYAQISQSAFSFTPTSTGLAQSLSVPFAETQAAVGEGTSTDYVVYDSLGIPLNVNVTTAVESKTGNNTVYRWFATSSENEPLTGVGTVLGTGLLTFNGQGDLVSSTSSNSTVTISRTATASNSPLAFDLDFTNVTSLEQSGGSLLNFTSQDGFPPGVLTNFAVTESGEIRGVYSNGVEQALGQIRMARFTNSGGLQQLGNNLFAEGVNSGEPQFGNPGAGGLGELTPGAVELSNTDIGQNLIKLILASTQYRGGARVITAVQQLLDELLALRR